MNQRSALSVAFPLVLTMFLAGATGCGASDTGGGAAGGSGSSGSGSAEGAQPGCEPTLRCAGSCRDQTCLDACVADATEAGAARFTAFNACGSDAGCQDLQCSIAACPGEYDACLEDLGEGGVVCYAEGIYLACDGAGNCAQKPALGGAWGTDDANAKAGAVQDCTDHMLSLIAIEQINGGAAEVGLSCSVYECGPNG